MTSTRRVLAGILAVAVVLSTGCRTISKRITESVLEQERPEEWHVRYGSRTHYTFTNETLDELFFQGTVLVGDTSVRYQRGLSRQAECIAAGTARLLDAVQERTGVAITTRSTIYLLRFDQRPQDFDIALAVEPNEFPLPLFVQVDEESCEAIIAQNRSYPYLFVHELVETSLAGEAGARVLPDLTWGALGLHLHVTNYTRWFRDGLANYAGYIAYRLVAAEVPAGQRLYHRQTLLHTEPFSSLAQVGSDLFSWPQSSRTGRERMYYNASLGLFLLIVDAHGEGAIREIVGQIASRTAVDGQDLIEITNSVLGTDVRDLVDRFEFPDPGYDLERLTPALALNRGVEIQEGMLVEAVRDGSAAAQAGLRRGDVITAIGETPVVNMLDVEMALFQARERSVASLTVRRQGTDMILEMPMNRQ